MQGRASKHLHCTLHHAMAQDIVASLAKSNMNAKDPSKSTLPMRRSCQFCRSRKIRCSGELICTACRSRNIDCLYGRETNKGRPRIYASGDGHSGRSFAAKHDSATNAEAGSSNSFDHAFYKQNTARNSPENLSTTDAQETWASNDSEGSVVQEQSQIVGASLDQCFKRTFGLRPESRKGVATANQSLPSRPPLSLSTLIRGLLEQSVRRFGCLVTKNIDDSPTVTSAWFEGMLEQASISFTSPNIEVRPTQDLLREYNTHQISQLLEIWFQHHPLSPIVSKTLILHGYRHNTHDHALLAVMLAYSLHALGPQNTAIAMELYQSAFKQIWSRTPTRSRSTAQILLLLGWHSITQGDLRQGYCFVSLARTLIAESYAAEPPPQSERINGIDVSNVEREVERNIYWIARSITLWMAMHMQLPFQDPSANSLLFPCSNDLSSAVTELDNASANYAGLVTRGRLMKQLWALTHVTSVVAAIYIMHPRSRSSFSTTSADDWQADIARRLHGIHRQPPDVQTLHEEIRKVLADGMRAFEREMGGDPGGILVISTFQILSTNLLFPRDAKAYEGALSEDFIFEVLGSISRLQFLLSAYKTGASRSADRVLDENSLLSSDCAAVLTMALDTGSRALDQLYRRCVISSGGEIKLLLARKADILALTTSLLDSCSDATLRPAGVGEVNVSEVISRFKIIRDKINGMDEDGLGAGNFQSTSYSQCSGQSSWQPPSIGSFGWEAPSMQSMMVPFEEPQNTFEDEQHGFMRNDQAFIDEMALNLDFFSGKR